MVKYYPQLIMVPASLQKMERIPTEIFRLILSEVTSPITPCGVANTLGQPNADLKAMRLCSKSFAEQATPYLFRTILVFITAESFARITAVANHTRYRHFVTEVRVFPRHFALESPFNDKHDYREHVDRLRLGDVYSDPQDLDQVPRMSEHYGLAYTHYTNMRKKQSELLPHVQALLQDAFGKFSTLKYVRAGRFGDDLRYKIKVSRPSLPPTLLDFHRKTLLLLSGDRQAIVYAFPVVKEFAEETVIIMRAVASSHANIEYLWLCDRRRSPNLSHVNLSASEFLSAERTFKKLRMLNFPLRGLDDPIDDIDHRPSLETWIKLLESASNLESLKLSGYSGPGSGYGDGFDQFSANACFPYLCKLELIGFSASGSLLSAFVKRHASTLKELELRDFLLLAGSWYGFFEDVRREGLDLCVWRLGCLCHYQVYFGDDRRHHQRKQLQKFLVEGQRWPPDLPLGLLKDAYEEYDALGAESEGNGDT